MCPDSASADNARAATPGPDAESLAAAEAVSALMRESRSELVAAIRADILARPYLVRMTEQFRIAESDDWLRQALSLFDLCMKSCGPAVVWNEEVGGLNFDVGLSIESAMECLSIIRDRVLGLVWAAASGGRLPARDVAACAAAVLRGFDSALAAQTSAYVRESRRHLSEMNELLRLRQAAIDRDLGLAQIVQQRFIPKGFASKNFRAEVRYIPTAGVGGDHAGIFPVSEERLYVTICDVTGHGVASALVAEVVSAQIRPALLGHTDTAFQYAVQPLQILRNLNTVFYNEFQDLGILVTMFVALFDVREGTLTYSGAGHPGPILQRADGGEPQVLLSQNIVLGAHEDCVLDDGESIIPIHAGDRVAFYTDGIIEAHGKKKILGVRGLQEVLVRNYAKPQPRIADAVIQAARRLYNQNPSEEPDDMSLILLDILGEAKRSADF